MPILRLGWCAHEAKNEQKHTRRLAEMKRQEFQLRTSPDYESASRCDNFVSNALTETWNWRKLLLHINRFELVFLSPESANFWVSFRGRQKLWGDNEEFVKFRQLTQVYQWIKRDSHSNFPQFNAKTTRKPFDSHLISIAYVVRNQTTRLSSGRDRKIKAIRVYQNLTQKPIDSMCNKFVARTSRTW